MQCNKIHTPIGLAASKIHFYLKVVMSILSLHAPIGKPYNLNIEHEIYKNKLCCLFVAKGISKFLCSQDKYRIGR